MTIKTTNGKHELKIDYRNIVYAQIAIVEDWSIPNMLGWYRYQVELWLKINVS